MVRPGPKASISPVHEDMFPKRRKTWVESGREYVKPWA